MTQQNKPPWRRYIVLIGGLTGLIVVSVGDLYFEKAAPSMVDVFTFGAGGAFIAQLIERRIKPKA
jgi:hypothetical protein